jgi:glycolate oxidase
VIKLIEQLIDELKSIVEDKWIVCDKEAIESYLLDETPLVVRPEPTSDVIVVKPENAEEISKILKIANERKIAVYPVGGKTGLVGGSIPIRPGIIISLERFKKIEVDKDNLMVVAEAGVTLGDLIKAAEDAGLSFPLHPGDEGAFVGGLIATNAGGARAIKYGVMRNYVKGIEVVLPTGEILSLGGKLLKNNTGYNLMHLIIGSEGTLGIITKAILKLYPQTKYSMTLIAPFSTRHDAIITVPKILRSGITPLAIEYVEQEDVLKAAKHLNEKWPVEEGFAQLIIILTDISEDELYIQAEEIEKICKENNSYELVIADTREEQERILKIRSNLYTTLKPEVCDILDVVVPPSKMSELMDIIDKIGKKYNARLPVYGHAGDGNLHVHIMKVNDEVPEYFKSAKREVYEASVKAGGVISGEHGIGRTRIKDLSLVLSEKEIEIMKAIKKVFDPNNILNPGKVVANT